MPSYVSILLLVFTGLVRAQDSPLATLQRIVDVQKKLPWFFTPYPEGIRDVPYAYEYRFTKRTLNARGDEVFPPKTKLGHYKQSRSMHFDHVPLTTGYGWHTRCIEQDGLPCIMEDGWELPPKGSSKDYNRWREQRREHRIAFWDEFLHAFRFEAMDVGHIRFVPTGTYRQNTKAKDTELFEILEGELWFDPASHEITRLQFELVKDAGNLFAKYYKGTMYAIELQRGVDGHYLPAKWSLTTNKRMLTRKGFEEVEYEYSNYRKFETSVTISLQDPK